MSAQVIIIERKKYAVGLFWQPVAVGHNSRNYAARLAKSVGKKLNLFTEYRTMVGLGSGRAGHYKGMSVAAAEAMEAFAEYSSLLAVFQVSNGFWLFAARNGIILEDRLFDPSLNGETAAKAAYAEMSAMPDWGALFAPGAWAAPRAVEKHLEDVVSANIKVSLKPVSHFKADFLSLFLLVVFIFGLAHFFREPVIKLIAPRPNVASIDPLVVAEYKKRIEEKNKELDTQFAISKKSDDVQPLVLPYDNIPDTKDRAQLCYQAIAFLMQPISGWTQTGVECLDATATATIERGYGNLGDFYEMATDLFPGANVRELSDSTIILTANLPVLNPRASLSELDAESVGREISTRFQRIDSDVNINLVTDIVENGQESVNINIVEIAAASKLIPPEFIKIFDDIDGVYITRIGWDAKIRTWNYEVIVYAK